VDSDRFVASCLFREALAASANVGGVRDQEVGVGSLVLAMGTSTEVGVRHERSEQLGGLRLLITSHDSRIEAVV
jgi:hypothetical protein